MSTETTEYNFAAAIAAVNNLRAEEPALAWVQDYQQSDKVVNAAQALQEKAELVTDREAARFEIGQMLLSASNDVEKSELAKLFDDVNSATTSSAIKLVLIRAQQAQNANKGSREGEAVDGKWETPEQKFQQMWKTFEENEKKANNIMQEANEAGYISDKDLEKSKKELEAINKLKDELDKEKDGPEKEEKMKQLAQMIVDHADHDKKLIEEAIKQARADGRIELAEKLEEAAGLKQEEKEKAIETVTAIAQDNQIGVNAQLKDNHQTQREELLDDEPEQVVAPTTQNQAASTKVKIR